MKRNSLRKPAPSPFRKHWPLDRRVVFLNHGSFGACPLEVLRHQAALRLKMESEPVAFLHRHYVRMVDEARLPLAAFLGEDPENLAFVTNATAAVNAVVSSWKLRRGDEILTTCFDYNACRNVLVEHARRAGAGVVVADVPFPIRSQRQVVDSVLAAVTPRTRFAMLDHVTSNTAVVLPIKRLVGLLETRGVSVLVDGAHAPGMLDLSPSRIGASWYVGNLHKWVCAPKGAAFIHVRQDRRRDIHPAVISHGNNTPRGDHPAWQDRFDWAGTFDPTAWFSVPKAIGVVGDMMPDGWSDVRTRNRAMILEARRMLCAALDVKAPCPESMIGSMATLPLPARFQGVAHADRIAPEQTRLFEEFGIEVPLVKVGGLRCFRVSGHLHNSADDYRYLAAALGRL